MKTALTFHTFLSHNLITQSTDQINNYIHSQGSKVEQAAHPLTGRRREKVRKSKIKGYMYEQNKVRFSLKFKKFK
jgi:hypothetical protein